MKSVKQTCAVFIVLGMCALWLLGCDTSAGSSSVPRVYFSEPKDGASVSSPVHVKLGADNFKVEPAGDVKPGSGHFHIIVDAACIAPGQAVANDATHLHYGKAQTEADLQLTPGTHRLCLQMADGVHVALAGDSMQQQITLTVK